ncbi:Metallophosphoesterase 1 [Folsomia candida]|uniref:Metallophosphoesterase 1 n=1 Tax=Folsomia candida TaxID=158441 RepID=A0A226F3Q2_FOLCA|nr:Metallophosphoesterase 1 [Folsomia candida]
MSEMDLRHRRDQRRWSRELMQMFLIVGLVFFLCEYAIYPLVLIQCSWPQQPQNADRDANVLRAMVLADTHLLGPFRGHWFDKLRREWQMHRTFQTAIGIFNPEVVFFLGDLFDEGEWVKGPDFDKYVSRFESLFSVPEHIDIYVVPGNHDIGFHYQTLPHKHTRFKTAFNSSSVRLLRLKEVNFVLINSMAMQMDDCFLCEEGLTELKIVKEFQIYSRPILLQHFPMYRESDSMCTGPDSAPNEEKFDAFRPTFECLSADSTKVLQQIIGPRLILSGHTHHYCLYNHSIKGFGTVPEYSVPSFSWRNRNDPSFFLGHFSRNEFFLSKCLMPKESTANLLYVSGSLLIICTLLRRILIYVFRCLWFVLVRRAR